MILYHASLDLEIIEEFAPRVPLEESRHILEDSTTKRVCLSSTISGALTAAPWGGGSLTNNIDLIPDNRLIRIYEFDTNDIDTKSIIYPGDLYKNDMVRDAEITGEHWILEKIKPKHTYIIKPTRYDDGYLADDISYENLQKLENNKELTYEEEEELIDGCFTVVELYDYDIVPEQYRSKLITLDYQVDIVDDYDIDVVLNEIESLFPYSPSTYIGVEQRNHKYHLIGVLDTRKREIDIRDFKNIIHACVDGIKLH